MTASRRIVDNPLRYQDLRSGIRRALTKRFPYAVYFTIRRRDNLCNGGPSYSPRSRRMAVAHLKRSNLAGQKKL